MNKYVLITGACVMVIVGLSPLPDMNPQVAVGFGMMWLGLAIEG